MNEIKCPRCQGTNPQPPVEGETQHTIVIMTLVVGLCTSCGYVFLISEEKENQPQ